MQGSVKNQPKQLSSISRNTVRHQPKTELSSISRSNTQNSVGRVGLEPDDPRIKSPLLYQLS